jgi:hypothetical protein
MRRGWVGGPGVPEGFAMQGGRGPDAKDSTALVDLQWDPGRGMDGMQGCDFS